MAQLIATLTEGWVGARRRDRRRADLRSGKAGRSRTADLGFAVVFSEAIRQLRGWRRAAGGKNKRTARGGDEIAGGKVFRGG